MSFTLWFVVFVVLSLLCAVPISTVAAMDKWYKTLDYVNSSDGYSGWMVVFIVIGTVVAVIAWMVWIMFGISMWLHG